MKTAKRAIVAAVLFCLGCSITITTIGGCLSMTRGAKPTTAPVVANTVAAPIKAAIAANELTGQAIARATTRAVSEPQKADLRQAAAGANTVRAKLSEADAAASDMDRVSGERGKALAEVKANSSLAVLSLLARLGAFELASPMAQTRVAMQPLSAEQWNANRAIASVSSSSTKTCGMATA